MTCPFIPGVATHRRTCGAPGRLDAYEIFAVTDCGPV